MISSEKLLLLCIAACLGLLVVLIQTYDNLKLYADILITILSVISSIIAISEFIKKR
ncbi:MAG: hypothetical protein SFU98_04570 [Leptospiraceae bacterium]|nr:hypothetical protein [Leptospiraceae bacterium]